MSLETDVQCYTTIHLVYIFTLSIPFIVIYVIGIPLFQFIVMCWYRKHLDDWRHLPFYGFLFKGLKSKYFYWETIEQVFKVCLIILVKFLDADVRLQMMLAAMIIAIKIIMINIMRPFKLRFLNDSAKWAAYLVIVWLFIGIILWETTSNTVQVLCFVVIITFIVWFGVKWIFYFIVVFTGKCIGYYHTANSLKNTIWNSITKNWSTSFMDQDFILNWS